MASSLLSGTNTAAAWYRSGGSHGQGSRGLAKHPPAVRRRRGGCGDTGIVGTDGRRDVQRRQVGEVEIRPQLLASYGECGVVQSFQLIRARSNDLRLRFCASCRLGVFSTQVRPACGPQIRDAKYSVHTGGVQTTRGLDRLVFFTDAVTAIAITLLVLPLVDSVTQAANAGQSAEQFIGNNFAAIAGFALSFVVIARLWLAHHAMFEYVRSYSFLFLLLNLFWVFTVVVLPLPTEMVSHFRTSPVTVGVYIGTIAASSLSLTMMSLMIRNQQRLRSEENPMGGRMVFASSVTTIGFVVALIVGVLVPVINFFGLLIILLTVPLQWVYDRRADTRRLARSAQAS